MTVIVPQEFLRALFARAVAAADPSHTVAANIPAPAAGRTVVVAAGKAAGAMARAFELAWAGERRRLTGLAVMPHGARASLDCLQVMHAAHPVPDEASLRAGHAALAAAASLGAADQLVVLLSGGASAVLAAPAPSITLADKQAVTRALLACGASIGEINAVRKHLSWIKGGRLACAAAPAPVLTLALSDVVGDDPETIGSGPTVGDSTTSAMARAVLSRYGIAVPKAVSAWIERAEAETPKPGDPRLGHATWKLVGSARQALDAAADHARTLGVTPVLLGDAIEGEAREVGRVLAGLARACRYGNGPARPPCVLISGGETTVTLRHPAPGRGGRNVECLLASALALQGAPGIYAFAADTDGIDGQSGAAGAWVAPDTLVRAEAGGIPARAALERHDAASLFARIGDLVVTGATGTNVNDFRALLVL